MAEGRYYSVHTHSRYSALDGQGHVAAHVERAKSLGYPALALTDHGSMAGTVELYRACREHGIKPLPGMEAYAAYGPKQRKVFHCGLVATSETGYKNLVQINNQMMQDFYYKPILDLTKINTYSTKDIVLTTGCFFGLAMTGYRIDETIPLNVIATLAEYFDVYVEAQMHGIEEEGRDEREDQLAALRWAKTLGLPMVIAQDSHYVDPADRPIHDNMKRLGSWSDDPDSAVFPGQFSYALASHDEMRAKFMPEVFEAGMAGLTEIERRTNVVIPPLEKFDPIIVSSSNDDEQIHDVFDILDDLPESKRQAYKERLEEELEVIRQFGFTGYMLLVDDIVEYLRKHGITYNVRGSAVGSLVCYALGISNIDPMNPGPGITPLGFDRFLSRNRAKLPDIDIDMDSERREEVIAWLRRTHVVTSIGTYPELGVWDGVNEMKGSAVVKWKTYQKKGGRSQVLTPDVESMLRELVKGGRVISGRGTHASGLVVAPDRTSMEWMPLAVIGSASGFDRFVTAFDKDSTESMGYIKVDLLGVKVLHAVGLCLRETGIELDQIPLNDRDVYSVMSQGLTDGVFQLAGWSARNGMRRMRPRNINDVIAAMALFRPATMDSGATDRYIARMKAHRNGRPQTYLSGHHPDVVDIIRDTYGELLYQEQVIDALKVLEFSPDELGQALKAIKASNSAVGKAAENIARLQLLVDDRAQACGWKAKDVRWLKGAFEAYANYGFNRAHATSYGLLAYRTAWLQYRHPGPFWQGMITAHAKDSEKVKEYTQALAERNFSRMPVDVNTSGLSIRVDAERKRIYPSLTSIKGIGMEIARVIEANRPYDSLAELADRLTGTRVSGVTDLMNGTPPGECPGSIGLLARAGALRTLE